jgi:hypothetical protein
MLIRGVLWNLNIFSVINHSYFNNKLLNSGSLTSFSVRLEDDSVHCKCKINKKISNSGKSIRRVEVLACLVNHLNNKVHQQPLATQTACLVARTTVSRLPTCFDRTQVRVWLAVPPSASLHARIQLKLIFTVQPARVGMWKTSFARGPGQREAGALEISNQTYGN